MHRGLKYSLLTLVASIALVAVSAEEKATPAPIMIKVDSSIHYQTMKGWGGVAQSGQGFPFFYKVQDQIVNLAVNDLGITRLTIGLRSSVENDHDVTNSENDEKMPIEKRFKIKNDNRDPRKINWNGFQFSVQDAAIENVVLPFRKALEAKGESLYLNLCYTNLGPSLLHRDHPDEYAELILAAFLHMKEKYGFVPDSVELINEPDNSLWSGKDIGKAMVAAAKVLKEQGFQPDFIAPSTTDMLNAPRFFDEMIAVKGASDVLNEFSYHRYRHMSVPALEEIVARAKKFQLRTSMTEFIGASSKLLHEDLKVANVSAWQQFTIAYPGVNDPGGAYYRIDARDPANPEVYMAKLTGLLRQYFHYIRPGALRVEATSSDDRFDPVGFINQNGKYVVVIQSTASGDIRIEGLPPAEYAVSFATRKQHIFSEEDLPYAEPLIVRCKESGVLTVFGK